MKPSKRFFLEIVLFIMFLIFVVIFQAFFEWIKGDEMTPGNVSTYRFFAIGLAFLPYYFIRYNVIAKKIKKQKLAKQDNAEKEKLLEELKRLQDEVENLKKKDEKD